jgi:hypothetical protein
MMVTDAPAPEMRYAPDSKGVLAIQQDCRTVPINFVKRYGQELRFNENALALSLDKFGARFITPSSRQIAESFNAVNHMLDGWNKERLDVLYGFPFKADQMVRVEEGTLKVGDTITIAGVNQVNPKYRIGKTLNVRRPQRVLTPGMLARTALQKLQESARISRDMAKRYAELEVAPSRSMKP